MKKAEILVAMVTLGLISKIEEADSLSEKTLFVILDGYLKKQIEIDNMLLKQEEIIENKVKDVLDKMDDTEMGLRIAALIVSERRLKQQIETTRKEITAISVSLQKCVS